MCHIHPLFLRNRRVLNLNMSCCRFFHMPLPNPQYLFISLPLFEAYTDTKFQTLSTTIMSHEPTKYGDVSRVPNELASKPISPQDAAAEARQDMGQRVEPDAHIGSAAIDGDPITIGEALEAVAISIGDKPVDQNDAAAISIAEIRATGDKNIRPGGVGATAQSAATVNSHVVRREHMTKLSDVLTDATEKLASDKAVTKEDADAVYAAEVQFPYRRDAPEVIAEPGGVAASMATAAKLNEEK